MIDIATKGKKLSPSKKILIDNITNEIISHCHGCIISINDKNSTIMKIQYLGVKIKHTGFTVACN